MSEFDHLFTAQLQTQPEQRTPEPLNTEQWKAQKQQERQKVFAMLNTATRDAAQNNSALFGYLNMQAVLPDSTSNTLLIYAQNPRATDTRTYEEWEADGISVVKKGAISLLEKTGDGYYNVEKVFDISQTDAPRAAKAQPPKATEQQILIALRNQCKATILPTDRMPEGVNARYDPDQRTIYIRQGMAFPDIFKALTRQMSLALIGPRTDGAECKAGCAAYILCKKYGVESGSIALGSRPKSFSGEEPADIRADLRDIRHAALTIDRNLQSELHREPAARNQPGPAR